jgi:hypothetical protein
MKQKVLHPLEWFREWKNGGHPKRRDNDDGAGGSGIAN